MAFCLIVSMGRLRFETDITKTLPLDDPVMNDAEFIFRNNPGQSRIAVDISLSKRDTRLLVKIADNLKGRMETSGFFREVGINKYKDRFPELISYIIRNFPYLFNLHEINSRIKPLISPDSIRKKMRENLAKLSGIEGIGQAEYISRDPLEFRNIVLEKLKGLLPVVDVSVREGYLLTADGNHLLIVAVPASSTTDTSFSKKVHGFFAGIDRMYKGKSLPGENSVTITPVGAYRASLDNEMIAKNDIQKALTFTTIGIILLLLISFPRPYMGILALVPAVSGSIISLFVYSLFFHSISLMAMGFGGAIISITVDHGITYLLFLDRPHETSGKRVAHEVKSLAFLAVLTSVGAFSLLTITGFKIFLEIGLFAAMGILFSFIFVHTVFPILFPVVPPARNTKDLFLFSLVNKLFGGNSRWAALSALFVFISMLFLMKPEFNIDIEKMNTVSRETREAERLVSEIWGNRLNGIHIMVEGDTLDDLLKKSNRINSKFEKLGSDTIASYFLPSSVIPGKEQAERNLKLWRTFWSRERIGRLNRTMKTVSKEAGFAGDAFDSFIHTLEVPEDGRGEISKNIYELLGIKKGADNRYLYFSTLSPGPVYKGKDFLAGFSGGGLLRIFDGRVFSDTLGAILSESFIRLLSIIGIGILALLVLFFMDMKLVLIAISPIVFSFVSTLGTLRILGRGLDIPALMLSVVVLGMGIDYSIYYIRAYQKYRDSNDGSRGLVNLSIVLASFSTLIGFGALIGADHSMFVSAGLTSFLGIAYAVAGTFTIQPYLLSKYFSRDPEPDVELTAGSREHLRRTLRRFRGIETYPRLFARFKIMFDPMFPRLADFIDKPRMIIDVGCGFGVPSAWVMGIYPDVRICAIEPDLRRAEIASHVFGNNGTVEVKWAPELPQVDEKADTALLLDMLHYLDDDGFRELFHGLQAKLERERRVIIRVTVPTKKKIPWERIIEITRLKFSRLTYHFRSVEHLTGLMSECGFTVSQVMPTAEGREEMWIIAQ